MKRKKVVRVEIEYEDGSEERAIGDDAEKIWQAIESGFLMNHIHGVSYDGPHLKPVEKV